VRGLGYHHLGLAERRHPTRQELDEAVPDRPLLLLHFTHHQGVANSPALAAAGITRATPDPPGGAIDRDRSGEPTGLLFERAISRCERASREGWEARFVEVVAAASRRHAALGITTLQDAAVGPAMERRYQEAERAGALGLRVERLRVSPEGWFEPPWALARAPGGGRWLKVFVDGGYRCAMRVERAGREVETGFLFYRRAELAELLVVAWRSGWRVACHAIGNVGVETAVGALEDALPREPAGEGRARLDHAIFLTRDLVRRVRALGVPVVSQPSFVYDLGGPAPDARLLVRPFRTIREAGIPQAFSSDAPCGTLAPLIGVYAAVTRRTRTGEASAPEEAVPVEAALAAYTIEAARAGGLERECGSLEAGKAADFVVLSGDPVAVPPEALPSLSVLRTYAGGRLLWGVAGGCD
jgi:predicted amidohydrolase YtcJ